MNILPYFQEAPAFPIFKMKFGTLGEVADIMM